MRWRSLPLLLLVAAGCGSDGNEPGTPEYRVTAASGASHSGPAGGRLLNVPLVLVTDGSGAPAVGVTMTLTLESGATAGFSLPETRVATGGDGVARADVVLGSAGTAAVRAQAPGASRPSATVTVTAAAAPVLTAVAPVSFGAGDVVVLTGTGLPTAEGGTTVLVGGVPATILAPVGGDTPGSTLRVRAPACVASGAVQVTARVGQVTTNALAATYTSSVAQPALDPLHGVTVSAAQLETCLSLAGEGARYLVIPQFATRDDAPASVRGTRPAFTIGAQAVGAPAAALLQEAPARLSAQQRLDRALREREQSLAPFAAGAARRDGRELAAAAEALELNSTRAFKVLRDLDGGTFADVTARLKFIGSNILVYVDQAAPAAGFTDAELTNLGKLFDRKLYPVAVDAFGRESDIDDNGHVVVLMTPVVNRLTTAAECEELGFVTGFFYGLDLTPSLANSNRAEVFYSLVPDEDGATGSCAHSVDDVNRIVPATFIHELQHMISWNQHVLVRGGPTEQLWLNEGLSHVAEELGSLLYERDPNATRTSPDQLFPDSSQGFINGNLLNAWNYLAAPQNVSTTLFTKGGSLEERGAAWLFVRWLADQKGDGVLRRLVETKLTGVANVVDKAGEPWDRLFGDYVVALYAADRLPGVTPSAIPQRYRFTSRDWRRIFKRLHDTNAPGVSRDYPIFAEQFAPDGNRSGSMLPGAMRYFELRNTTGTPRATLRFVPGAGASFPEGLGAQVTIFRLPTGS